MLKIVIDAMGADNGVAPIIEGVKRALSHKEFQAILVGDKDLIAPFISSALAKKVEIAHCADFIKMEESAAVAAKRKDSSIYVGSELLRESRADALVSAGHSGATMSLATLKIGRIQGVSRPAICTLMPSITDSPSMILDAGANTDCKPEYLVDFAIMGCEYAKNVMGYPRPRVGLLANGEEDSKGNELTKEAFKILKNYEFFKGNVEGNDIFNGSVDVIVCDGFSGNIVLKAAEGVAGAISHILKSEIKSSWLHMLGGALLKGAFANLKKKMDYAEYGGAPLLGVNKTVIISHGKSNARAIECAIYQALRAIESQVCEKIAQAFAFKAQANPHNQSIAN
ncbi:phosphate acyltransferase [Helicobacter sp. 12S02634-8]|uniref:phosphate acyltransferase PlsX n=1 Tax=Helicobacter sp. 12S02634-8 TaxID=1476199 RepID=UPI000BA54AFA|nr:phosphate acyltransferase PlsX [Helicobacter sp. 12S02634-8]PAF47149.1 phosphate acyltransferase [Helicobacter sp. 12S02634-8]